MLQNDIFASIGGFHIVNQVVIQQVTLVQNVSSGRELKTT